MIKSLASLAVVAVLVASLVALGLADVLTDTGVTMANIEAAALANLKADGLFYVEPTALMRRITRRIPADAQAATVRALGRVVRTYAESDAFRQTYRQSLSEQYNVDQAYSDEKIAQREAEVGMVDGAVEAQTATLRQTMSALDSTMFYTVFKAQVPQLEAQAAAATGTERTQLTQEVADLKRMLAANAGKPAEFKKQYVAYQEQRLRKSGKQYEANASQELADAKIHNAEYRKQKAALDAASDVRPPLRKQLRAFVALCDEVDFGAKLYASRSKQYFVNPAYERKPGTWKLLFRMGKTSTMAARQSAQEWLTALP
ncbi:hypothetical protein [Spirosoma sordidisoli]|uniref:Uncharacterized protein n=1 Tax=Spirosoma sordidisoli TaxID=2502893 RepID=A0A4V1RVF8_9BACT|nr:hypothetical protein [Spirosoma sordidisoli]RYC66618.1 hypothetical protein EQG79_28930 [Spirosoma sordidisoli]